MLLGCGSNKKKITPKLIAVPQYEAGSINIIKNALTTSTSSIQLAANSTIPFMVFAINSKETTNVTGKAKLTPTGNGFSVDNNEIKTNETVDVDDPSNNTGSLEISLPANSPYSSYKGSLNITIVDIPICGNGLGRGNGINDTDKNNGKGTCIKVVSTNTRKDINKVIPFSDKSSLFAGTPSCSLTTALKNPNSRC